MEFSLLSVTATIVIFNVGSSSHYIILVTNLYLSFIIIHLYIYLSFRKTFLIIDNHLLNYGDSNLALYYDDTVPN
jgi:hypothetical protein